MAFNPQDIIELCLIACGVDDPAICQRLVDEVFPDYRALESATPKRTMDVLIAYAKRPTVAERITLPYSTIENIQHMILWFQDMFRSGREPER